MIPTRLSALALLAASLAGCSAAAGPPADGDGAAGTPRSVRIAHVVERSGDIGLTASGTLVPRETFAASGDVPGMVVRRVLVDEGSYVRAGEVLAELDGSGLASQIAQQEAIVAQHRTALRQAEEEARRAQPMAGEGVLSLEAVQARRFRADGAQGALRVQEALLADLRRRAARLIVRAPVDGRILERAVRVGDVSGAPQPMFTIVQGTAIELRAQVPENRLADIRVGMPAEVTLADGTRMEGHVATLGGRIERQSAQGEVRLRLSPLPGESWPLLRPGASGSARFRGTGSMGPAVPEAAVQYEGDGSTVMALGDGNRVRTVAVRTGARSDGYVALVEGPPVGSAVLLGSGAFVSDGDVVDPVRTSAAARR